MLEYLMRFFQELEALITPPEKCHHVMLTTRYGSDETGWQDKLTVSVNDKGIFYHYFLDAKDFDLTPEVLADTLARLHVIRPENAQKSVAAGSF